MTMAVGRMRAVGREACRLGAWAVVLAGAGCTWTRADPAVYRIEPRFLPGEHIQVSLRAAIRVKAKGMTRAGRVTRQRELQYVERYRDQVLATRQGEPATVIRHWFLAERVRRDGGETDVQRRPWHGLTLKAVRRGEADTHDLYAVGADGGSSRWQPADPSLADRVRHRLRDDLDMTYFAPKEPVRV